MWCPVCSADVATELSADDRRLHCARCGVELRQSEAALHRWGRGTANEQPQDLLARWTAEEILAMESRHSVPEGRDVTSPGSEREAGATQASTAPSPTDGAQMPSRESASKSRRKPHPRRPPTEPAAQGWVAAAGQLAAYGGVLVLTAGTVMVISAHFSRNGSHAATGWLVASVGQMLLFLGVITVVAQGIEQVRRELQTRLDRLERRLRRIQQQSLGRETASGSSNTAQRSRTAA